MKHKLRPQGDLFLPPVTDAVLEGFRHAVLHGGEVILLGAPEWSDRHQAWVAVANVGGMLALVEVVITAEVP